MKFQNIVRGLTEGIHFNEDGLRDSFYIELLQFIRNETGDRDNNYKKIATYDTENGIKLLSDFSNVEEQTTISMQAKVFKVIIRNGMPFVRKK